MTGFWLAARKRLAVAAAVTGAGAGAGSSVCHAFAVDPRHASTTANNERNNFKEESKRRNRKEKKKLKKLVGEQVSRGRVGGTGADVSGKADNAVSI